MEKKLSGKTKSYFFSTISLNYSKNRRIYARLFKSTMLYVLFVVKTTIPSHSRCCEKTLNLCLSVMQSLPASLCTNLIYYKWFKNYPIDQHICFKYKHYWKLDIGWWVISYWITAPHKPWQSNTYHLCFIHLDQMPCMYQCNSSWQNFLTGACIKNLMKFSDPR